KGLQQHGLCCFLFYPPCLKIKEGFFVKLTGGAAMRTFYIVSPNLQLRFGVDGGIIGEQNISVGLKGVCFLCVRSHKYLSVEYAFTVLVHDPLVQFVAEGVGFLMVCYSM